MEMLKIMIGSHEFNPSKEVARLAAVVHNEFHGSEDEDGVLTNQIIKDTGCTVEQFVAAERLLDTIMFALEHPHKRYINPEELPEFVKGKMLIPSETYVDGTTLHLAFADGSSLDFYVEAYDVVATTIEVLGG